MLREASGTDALLSGTIASRQFIRIRRSVLPVTGFLRNRIGAIHLTGNAQLVSGQLKNVHGGTASSRL